jgi:hypothetical protein
LDAARTGNRSHSSDEDQQDLDTDLVPEGRLVLVAWPSFHVQVDKSQHCDAAALPDWQMGFLGS